MLWHFTVGPWHLTVKHVAQVFVQTALLVLIVSGLCRAKLILGTPLEHLKKSLPIVVNRIDQVNRVVYQPLLDHVIQQCLAGEGRTRIYFDQPALEVFVKDHVKAIQVEAVRVKCYIVLRGDQGFQADLLDLGPNLVFPVDLEIFSEGLAQSRKTDFGASIDSVLLIAIVVPQVILIDRHICQMNVLIRLICRV